MHPNLLRRQSGDIDIYRHLLDEGVGLRQLVDYYYILQHSSESERQEAVVTLTSFRMKRFVGAVIYVMQEVLGMEEKEGVYLMVHDYV